MEHFYFFFAELNQLLFCIERVTYQELPQNNAKCKKKGRQKGRAKRAPLCLRPFLKLLVQFQKFANHQTWAGFLRPQKTSFLVFCIFCQISPSVRGPQFRVWGALLGSPGAFLRPGGSKNAKNQKTSKAEPRKQETQKRNPRVLWRRSKRDDVALLSPLR